jgi:hypothetical protein
MTDCKARPPSGRSPGAGRFAVRHVGGDHRRAAAASRVLADRRRLAARTAAAPMMSEGRVADDRASGRAPTAQAAACDQMA